MFELRINWAALFFIVAFIIMFALYGREKQRADYCESAIEVLVKLHKL